MQGIIWVKIGPVEWGVQFGFSNLTVVIILAVVLFFRQRSFGSRRGFWGRCGSSSAFKFPATLLREQEGGACDGLNQSARRGLNWGREVSPPTISDLAT